MEQMSWTYWRMTQMVLFYILQHRYIDCTQTSGRLLLICHRTWQSYLSPGVSHSVRRCRWHKGSDEKTFSVLNVWNSRQPYMGSEEIITEETVVHLYMLKQHYETILPSYYSFHLMLMVPSFVTGWMNVSVTRCEEFYITIKSPHLRYVWQTVADLGFVFMTVVLHRMVVFLHRVLLFSDADLTRLHKSKAARRSSICSEQHAAAGYTF